MPGPVPASSTRALSPGRAGVRAASVISSGPPRARSAGGRGAVTSVPAPGRGVTRPSACSPVATFAAVARETPNCWAISRPDGSMSPSCSRPDRISCR